MGESPVGFFPRSDSSSSSSSSSSELLTFLPFFFPCMEVEEEEWEAWREGGRKRWAAGGRNRGGEENPCLELTKTHHEKKRHLNTFFKKRKLKKVKRTAVFL